MATVYRCRHLAMFTKANGSTAESKASASTMAAIGMSTPANGIIICDTGMGPRECRIIVSTRATSGRISSKGLGSSIYRTAESMRENFREIKRMASELNHTLTAIPMSAIGEMTSRRGRAN